MYGFVGFKIKLLEYELSDDGGHKTMFDRKQC